MEELGSTYSPQSNEYKAPSYNSTVLRCNEEGQRGIYRYLVSIISILCFTSGVMSDASKMGFWEKQRKGANQQNERHRPEWYRAAGELGLDYVRILPDAWPADNRDFLIGNADNFEAINGTDLALLIEALNEAESNGIKVVLAMASLPGVRWTHLVEF